MDTCHGNNRTEMSSVMKYYVLFLVVCLLNATTLFYLLTV